MITYLTIGLIVGFLIEFINEKLGSPEIFEWKERIVIILMWPIFIVVFFVSMFS